MTNPVRRNPKSSTPGASLLFASVLCMTLAAAGNEAEESHHGSPHEAPAENSGHAVSKVASPPPPHGGSSHGASAARKTGHESVSESHATGKADDAEPSHGNATSAEHEGAGDLGAQKPPAHGDSHATAHEGEASTSGKHPQEGGHAPKGGSHELPAHAKGPHEAVPPKRPPLDSGTLAGPLRRKEFVWRAKKGPLRLLSDVVVGPGQTLEIGPGTEIWVAPRDREPAGTGDWVDSQYVSLIVAGGTLRILGTPSRPVRFLPQRRGSAPHWGGIRVVDAHLPSQVEIAWADIPRAHVGIDLDRSAATLRHVVVRDASIGIRVAGGSSPEISNSIVFGSRIAGLHSERSGPVVRGCILVGSAGVGARFEGAGLARLESNAFWDNAGGDLQRPPPKVGGWAGDSIVRPDVFGNVRTNPVFRASSLHAHLLARKTDSLKYAPIWKRRLPENPWGEGPWALSPFSPLLDRGSLSPLCRDRDGTRCDIGLWGGKD